MNVLVLNAGSSSLKFRLFDAGAGPTDGELLLAHGLVEKWGTPEATLRLTVRGKDAQTRSVAAESSRQAAEHALRVCLPLGIDALGHRVVHGGPHFERPARVTPEVVAAIKDVSHLAPLHNKLALAGIEAGLQVLPQTPAFAVFDTAFHMTLPREAFQYALPRKWAEDHDLRRYGFHGISHQYVSGELLKAMGRPAQGSRLVTCHLGNGASLCAIRDGRSVETSMGLTPMEGLVMGTRSGDIDPGLVLHLITGLGMKAEEVDDLLNRKSGLLGLSGRSGDVRDLENAEQSGDAPAAEALESFAYRARKYIGAYAAVLGGLDAVAFTGGIGEHSAKTRERICRGLEFLGIRLDPQRNGAAATENPLRISSVEALVQVWVISTDEERQIAREIRAAMGNASVR